MRPYQEQLHRDGCVRPDNGAAEALHDGRETRQVHETRWEPVPGPGLRAAGAGSESTNPSSSGRLPEYVFVSEGSRKFHRSRGCKSFWGGLDKAANDRGGPQRDIYRVSILDAAHIWKTSLCQTCFPSASLNSDFGRLGEANTTRGRRPPRGPKYGPGRDHKDFAALGLTPFQSATWCTLGFTPTMTEETLKAGVTYEDAALKRQRGMTAIEVVRWAKSTVRP